MEFKGNIGFSGYDLREQYNINLTYSMTFSHLFFAVNSDFIIERGEAEVGYYDYANLVWVPEIVVGYPIIYRHRKFKSMFSPYKYFKSDYTTRHIVAIGIRKSVYCFDVKH